MFLVAYSRQSEIHDYGSNTVVTVQTLFVYEQSSRLTFPVLHITEKLTNI